MTSTCKSISRISAEAHKWITMQPNVGEESLTDWVLYEVSKRIKKTGYIKFNRHQEARETGADWEWWFIGNTKSLRLRVQAKKIEGVKDAYPALAYTNQYGLQIEKLIKDATTENAIPIYAFYTASHGARGTKCQRKEIDVALQGVFIAGANKLFSAHITPGRKPISPSALIADSTPLPCLFCCSIKFGVEDAVLRLRELIGQLFMTEGGQSVFDPNSGLHDNYPNYVHQILENPGQGMPEWWEDEFSRRIEGFDAVMVFDYRTGDIF